MPLEAIRKIAGHTDERTTLPDYCFNRLTDEETYNKVVKALDADKSVEDFSVTECDTRIISFSQNKKRGKIA